MSDGTVDLSIEGGVASVTFNRPEARNAMTWAMYEQLQAICGRLSANANVRVVRFQGAGAEAFVAGTDIAQFQSFSTGDHGVDYERRIDAAIALLESLPMPAVAVVQGWCVGGGLAIATACDFRIATVGARFGVPIAKTLGNCLSVGNLARLTQALGVPRVKRMLLLAELLPADELLTSGYLTAVCEAVQLDATAARLSGRLASLAPVTQAVSKEGLRRLVTHSLPEGDDLIRRCYGSDDFHEGVTAFMAKRNPAWTGH